ncbi:MAG TPA: MFS transporter [Gemmatimonadales bacterium]|nr:MFS transporter [Gemmatimonadales bacterium]
MSAPGTTRLLVLFVTAFVDMVGITMLVPILPYYATNLGASATVVGIIVSAFSLAQLLTATYWGRASDRHGRRPALIAGLLVTAVGYMLFAVAGSVPLLLLSRIVQGMGGGTIGVVHAYIADVSTPGERTRTLGWLSAVTSLGAVLGPAIGAVLVRIGGPSLPGWAAAVFAVLVAIFGWTYLRESRVVSVHTGEHPVPGRSALANVALKWRERPARLILTYALGIGAFYGIIPLVPLLLGERLGITEDTVGYFVMYLGAIGVLMRTFALDPLVRKLGEPRLARAGVLLLAAGLVATALPGGWLAVAAGFTLMPVGTACLFPAVTSLLSQAVRDRERGLYMGVQQTWGGVSRVAFPVLGGVLMDVAGVGTPFAVAGILLLLALPLTVGLEQVAAGDTTH